MNATGTYTLTFANYRSTPAEKPAVYTLDNIQIIDITGINPENVLANSDNMAIFVPVVLSFNDYYPYGMLMPNSMQVVINTVMASRACPENEVIRETRKG